MGNETWGKGSSCPGANTLFEGQQINGQTHREMRREDTHTHTHTHTHTQKRDTEERSKMQIKEDPSSRSKEEPGPLRDTTPEGPSTL
jgi:hypothetical protein